MIENNLWLTRIDWLPTATSDDPSMEGVADRKSVV